MLPIRIINPHAYEILGEGFTVLISYNQPIAAYVQSRGYFRTNRPINKTMEKDLQKWLGANKVDLTREPQPFFDHLAAELALPVKTTS